jgi:thiol-disulfide isomerase/thioredoxin
MKSYIIFLFLFFFIQISTKSMAQVKTLAIGDQIPDVTLSQLVNYKSPSAKLYDLRHKLLIIDFWGTWCSPCVAMLPKTAALEKKFSGQVAFLPVSREAEKTVVDFLARLRQTKNLQLYSVVQDTVLNGLFPHSTVPYYVWINQEGKVIATTEQTEVNEKTIQAVLNGNLLAVHHTTGIKARELNLKKTIFIPGLPFINENKDSSVNVEALADSQVISKSILTRYIPQLHSILTFDSTHFVIINGALMNFYRLYFGMVYRKSPVLFWSKSRCLIEVKDSILYHKIVDWRSGAAYDKWLAVNGFCYELNWKNVKTWEAKRALLKDDLDRYFSKPLMIDAGFEKRLAASDVLNISANKISLNTNGQVAFERHDAYSYKQQNLPLSHFIDLLQTYFWQNSDRGLFDETGIKGNVDLELNCNMNDIDAVNKELAKYGLHFSDQKRMMDVVVIKSR